MTDRTLNKTEYAALVGVDIHTFNKHRAAHPEQFCPSFFIGKNERWFLSRIMDFYKALEGSDNTTQEGGFLTNTTKKGLPEQS